MVQVADASVAIRGDMSGFHRDLGSAEQATSGFAGRIKKILSPSNVIGAAGLFGVGLGVRQLVDYAGDAAGAYAELEQTVRTIDGVFGDSADVIRDWGETAAESAGMSQQTFMSSAAVMGQTLINMGYNAEEAAEKVTQLLQRAADLALAFGKRPQDALLAITAAMRGERDTIEKFGVAIKQVDVNAQIAALGLDTSTAAAKKNAEAIAVVNLVLEQSAQHAGRFADSQEDIAVKMARANAKIEDFNTQQVGPAIASIQLGAIKVAESVGSYFETAGDNIDTFALNFGSQRAQIAQTAADLGMDFVTLKDRIVGFMQDGMDFETALTVAADPEGAHQAGLILMGGVGDAIAQGAKEFVDPATFEMMKGVGDMISSSERVITDASEVIAKIPEDQIKARYEAIRGVGYQTVLEYAAGLLTPQSDVQIAIEAALQVIEDEMSITEELAYLSGQKTVLEEARGIASQEGKDASVLAIDAAMQVIEDRMNELANSAYDYGKNTVSSYAWGIVNNLGLVHDAGRQLAQGVASQARIESEPPDHNSPLYGITKWGGNIVKTIAGGMLGELGTGTNAAAALAGALVPAFGGSLQPAVLSQTSGGGLGNTYNVHLEDRIPVRSVRDIGFELRRLGEMGLLPGSLTNDK
jgi:hypothetical protein